MIIELSLDLNSNEFFLASWELSETIWNNKEKEIKDFLDTTIKSYDGSYSFNIDNTIKNNIQYLLSGKPNLFFNTQNRLNEYLNTIGGKTLVL